MISSMLDNDQYKFTMQQAILKLGFAAVPVEYKFKCRRPQVDFSIFFNKIKNEIFNLRNLTFKKDELDYLRSLRYFSSEYVDFLKNFKFDLEHVFLDMKQNGDLDIRIRGPWFQTILFEVPILATISEVYSTFKKADHMIAKNILLNKLDGMPANFKFVDFGTRRRYSFDWHEETVSFLKGEKPKNFIGTSNLYLAKLLNIPAIGTMAHEWLQAHQQLNYRVVDSQKMAFENWIKVYRGDLGIALSDVINTDAFLKDFEDPFFYKLFDGVREDSEPDPIQFGHKIINFYLSHGIQPRDKTIVFSNGLNFKKAYEIYDELHNLVGLSFGIGTNLTNDWGFEPLNIVIKMINCNESPVAKISNSIGKSMCEDEGYVEYLKYLFNVKS
ncbi:MAG: nicotinate phosphoribosyltransferase [Candidatus Thorarchaeota archaeon]|jgi:nicotinate phosphoribosyltransferase